MQSGRAFAPATGVVFDSAFGQRPDDALALALLFGFEGLNEARLLSVSIGSGDLQAAQACDAIAHFYHLPVPGGQGGTGHGGFTIGLLTTGASRANPAMLSAALLKTDADGKPVYTRTLETVHDTADPLPQMRNALNAQPDQNVIVVETGPATNLARLLALPAAKDMIARKVKYLVIAAGSYPNGAADAFIRADIPAARKLFAEWPTPIVAAGTELGAAFRYPASSIEKDFAWAPSHPVADAYRAWQAMPYDAPAGALAAALYAVKPAENYFALSPEGAIEALPDGRTRFSAAASGKHRYLLLDEARKAAAIETIARVASMKPVPPAPRFPRPAEDQDQKKAAPG